MTYRLSNLSCQKKRNIDAAENRLASWFRESQPHSGNNIPRDLVPIRCPAPDRCPAIHSASSQFVPWTEKSIKMDSRFDFHCSYLWIFVDWTIAADGAMHSVLIAFFEPTPEKCLTECYKK